MALSNNQKINAGKYKKWIIAFSILCIIALGYFKLNYLVMGYYYVFKFDHFEAGDKVYIAQTYFNDKSVNALGTMELIRPLTKADLDTMGYTFKEKLTITPQINDSLKPYLSHLGPSFDIDKMKQYKSGFIGTFKGYKITYVKDISNKHYVRALYAIIEPNKKVFDKDYSFTYAPPKNYTLADSNIYVVPFYISRNELANY